MDLQNRRRESPGDLLQSSGKIDGNSAPEPLRASSLRPRPSYQRANEAAKEVIFSYSRAQAIADRALIDVNIHCCGSRFPLLRGHNRRLDDAIETIPPRYSHEDMEGRFMGRALDRIALRAQSETRMLSNCL